MNDQTNPSQRFGTALVSQGLISPDQLRIALDEQRKSGLILGAQLVQLGFVSETTIREALSSAFGVRSVDLSRFIPEPEATGLVPAALAKRHHLVPLHWDPVALVLTVATTDVGNIVALDRLQAGLPPGSRIMPVLADAGEILRALEQAYDFSLDLEALLPEVEAGIQDMRAARQDEQYAQPVVRFIDAVLADAVRQAASDIHFEPEENFLRIRYRTDGLLRQVRVLNRTAWQAMAVRLKVMAQLDIAESRSPQDGRISATIQGRRVDFRIACQPTIHGECIVLRVLDLQKGTPDLLRLGLSTAAVAELRRLAALPEGLILFTGPTGSGKTTTMYAILGMLCSEQLNIMTLEDPVEYPMPLIRQTSVGEGKGLDFANGIRSMLRQDPDVILVGEIRDAETAAMSFQAAMTGHRVFSTLHSNSSLGAIPRLTDLGVAPEILAGGFSGIVAQRLLRTLCTTCRRPLDTSGNAPAWLDAFATATLFEAVGCPACHFTGYRGRSAIIEILAIDPYIQDLIARRAPLAEMGKAARARGFKPLLDAGLAKVATGLSTLDELSRVVDLGAIATTVRAQASPC